MMPKGTAITKEHSNMSLMKLSDEALESVVGGLIESQQKAAERFAYEARRHGLTLDEAIEKARHPKIGRPRLDDEMIQYMIDYWNSNYS